MLDLHRVGDVWVLNPAGKLCLGLELLVELRDFVDRQLEMTREFRKVLLNFERVTKVDDAAAGELNQMARKLSQKGGEMRFLNLTKSGVKVPRLLARLGMIASTYDDETAAVSTFE